LFAIDFGLEHAIFYSMKQETATQRIQVIEGTSYVYEDYPYWEKHTVGLLPSTGITQYHRYY